MIGAFSASKIASKIGGLESSRKMESDHSSMAHCSSTCLSPAILALRDTNGTILSDSLNASSLSLNATVLDPAHGWSVHSPLASSYTQKAEVRNCLSFS